MSAPSIFGGRLASSAVTSMAGRSPRMASQQLARLHTTTIRPSPTTTPKLAIQRHVQSIPSQIARPAVRMQSTAPVGKEEVKLDWNSFFKLRASRRRYSLASSVASALVSTTVGVQVLSSQDLESLGAQVMGLDPFIVLGMATAACGAVGWLLGPVVGNGIWGLVYRRFLPSVKTVSEPMSSSISCLYQWSLKKSMYRRKRRSSSIAFADSVSIPLPTRSPTPSPITTARRLEASKATANGSRTSGLTTGSAATSLLNCLCEKW